jgi:hypothetical protein
MSLFINKKVIVTKMHCKINLNIYSFSKQIGVIKGVKKTWSRINIYLIELLDHSRIWMTEKEIISSE